MLTRSLLLSAKHNRESLASTLAVYLLSIVRHNVLILSIFLYVQAIETREQMHLMPAAAVHH